jgi:hypothetical protein
MPKEIDEREELDAYKKQRAIADAVIAEALRDTDGQVRILGALAFHVREIESAMWLDNKTITHWLAELTEAVEALADGAEEEREFRRKTGQ